MTYEVKVHCTLQEGKWLRYWSAERLGFHPTGLVFRTWPAQSDPPRTRIFVWEAGWREFATVQADATNQDACEKAVRNAASVLMRITAPFWGKEAVSPDTTT